jgi:DNA-binding Lrp family transcriptional regulator
MNDFSYHIDSTDKMILWYLAQNARIGETALSNLVNKSREAVSYRIKNLEKHKIILGYSLYLDFAKLGFQGYKVYLKLKNDPKQKEKFFLDLKSRSNVFWLALGDGVWDVGITFIAKSNEDFYFLKSDLFSKYSNLILEKFTGSLVSPIAFGEKFLHPDFVPQAANLSEEGETFTLSDEDRNLLSILFSNSRLSLVMLARKSNLSIDQVKNRLGGYLKNGIIKRFYAEIDYSRIAYEFYKTFVYLSTLSREEEDAIFQFCKQHPNIVNFVRVISPWDLELEIIVENYSAYSKTLNLFKEKFKDNVRNCETTLMIGSIVYPSRKI